VCLLLGISVYEMDDLAPDLFFFLGIVAFIDERIKERSNKQAKGAVSLCLLCCSVGSLEILVEYTK